MNQLERLSDYAIKWQDHHCRTTRELITKIEGEVAEYWQADEHAEKLDELGDIIICALRAFSTLSADEKDFLVRVMKMKVVRRTGEGGVKDEAVEARYVARLAKELLT